MAKITAQTEEYFSSSTLEDINTAADNMVKVVSRSSMVSMFEKANFRDFVGFLSGGDRDFLVKSLGQIHHGQQQAGFEAIVDLLQSGKLAKWT